MIKRVLVGAVLLGALSNVVLAGPAEDAQTHFKAIADGKVDELMKAYTNDAVLHWVGGPLDGAYAGTAEVRKVWSKFTQAQGPLTLNTSKVESSANPTGATVTADVEFKGKAPIKVRYVLLYRDGKLVNEIWQIDPTLTLRY
jgi:ketosteroid isomerase-like protein